MALNRRPHPERERSEQSKDAQRRPTSTARILIRRKKELSAKAGSHLCKRHGSGRMVPACAGTYFYLRRLSAFVLAEIEPDILRDAMPVEQQERALPRRAGRLLELLRGFLRRADRLLIDRQDDIAARQPQRVGGAAVIDAGDDDASDVASEMQLAAHVD